MNRTKEGIEVKVGQIWRDLDKRMNGRTITITAVDGQRAHYEKPVRNRVSIKRLCRPYWEFVK